MTMLFSFTQNAIDLIIWDTGYVAKNRHSAHPCMVLRLPLTKGAIALIFVHSLMEISVSLRGFDYSADTLFLRLCHLYKSDCLTFPSLQYIFEHCIFPPNIRMNVFFPPWNLGAQFVTRCWNVWMAQKHSSE